MVMLSASLSWGNLLSYLAPRKLLAICWRDVEIFTLTDRRLLWQASSRSVGWNRGLGYAPGPSDARFREFRRLFHQFMGPRPSQETSVLKMQEQSARDLVSRLMNNPDGFMKHARQVTGALILRLAYGYVVSPTQDEDELVNIAERAMQGFARASEPGAFLVDSFPFLKHLPDWVPGTGWKAEVRQMWEDRECLYDVPFDFVQDQMRNGEVTPSFTSTYLLEKITPSPVDEELIKAAAASLYSGGADTTPSTLSSFILAMALHPATQARAQAELDAVLGSSWIRLPTFADRLSLPYVNAIVLELLRWNPAVPLGLPHKLSQDDIYRNCLLPKGTIVWPNIWSMLHDETKFPNPSAFLPERYLLADGRLKTLDKAEDPVVIGFGFGRRICPGMYLAINSVFISVATMLYTLRVSKAKNEMGVEITPEPDYRGFIAHPAPFNVSIVPRSLEAEALVHKSMQEDSDFGLS
ncbi:cytochrome P450, partial [Obba rivulosa]